MKYFIRLGAVGLLGVVLIGAWLLAGKAAAAWPVTMPFDGAGKCTPWTFNRTEIVPEGYEGSGCKLYVREGSTEWGGRLGFPDGLGKGTRIYFELYMKVNSPFRVVTRSGAMKFLRFYSRHADGGNGGALDIMIAEDGYRSEFRVIREKQFKWFDFTGPFEYDRWHRFNVEFEVDDVPLAHGGRSYVKVWLDGQLIAFEKRIQTITRPDDTLKDFLLFSYFNSGSPIDQSVLVDSLTLTDKRPDWWDSLGATLQD